MKFITFFLFVFLSCSNQPESTKTVKSEYLINSTSTFVMEASNEAMGYYNDRTSFIKPFISNEYKGDTLIATTLHEINGCAKTIGQIKFSNDTLYLLTKREGDEACASVEFHKFKYTIVKKDIKTYTIVF